MSESSILNSKVNVENSHTGKVQLDAEWDTFHRKMSIIVAINYEILTWIKLTDNMFLAKGNELNKL